ncbi:MAG: hypothetical protein SW833_16000 [Cyanobacteriota bacterium]|nr:hypothetical protein [Cyanobacteriota bacterium]
MDEPDAYLSSQAQQDLLKIFNLFANPEKGSHLERPIQVVYVTHSPFLIDKNHAERIRVLQKGNDDEGTRVVKNVAKNHYEPLRSSMGVYVSETTFIGNCNLMVEGITDQILIAGAATYLRSQGVSSLETLDLNQITIVPSGSASHVPYLVYLARGRDVEQPAVIVLLDSDESGNNAKQQLLDKKGGQHRKPLLKESFILQIGDLKEQLKIVDSSTAEELEIEDIIPLPICLQAVKFYLQEFLGLGEHGVDFVTENWLEEELPDRSVFKAINKKLPEKTEQGFQIEKVGFVRNIIKTVDEWSREQSKLDESQKKALLEFKENFIFLFKELNHMQRRAQREFTKERLSQKIDRLIESFISDHPSSAKRESAFTLLEEIEDTLNDNKESHSAHEIHEIENAIKNLRRDYNLEDEMGKSIDNYDQFKADLKRIKYAGLLAVQESSRQKNPESEPNEDKLLTENDSSTTSGENEKENTKIDNSKNTKKRLT